MQEKPTLTLKISFSGESAVGKTALIEREVLGCFRENRMATIGIDIQKKQYLFQQYTVNVQFWHLDGGTEGRRSVYRKSYFGKSNIICLCFALDDLQNFRRVPFYLNTVREMGLDCRIFLIGCKQDLPQTVPQEEIEALAEKEGLKFFKCSSKTNSGVNEAFHFMVHQATERLINNPQKLPQDKNSQGKQQETKNSLCDLI